MSTNPHKTAALGQIHSPVNWTFSTASLRRAVGAYVATDLGSECMQTDTSPPTFWKLAAISGAGLSVTPTWVQINTTADALFTGDFAARFASYSGLTVRSYKRGDLGRSGSTGSGFSSWANQSGDGSAMVPGSAASSNGIGSSGTGLNGLASIVTNGVSQNGSYTHPTGPAPGTTNHHIYAVERVLATPASAGYMHSANSAPVVYVTGGQTTPAAEMLFGNGSTPTPTTGVVINQWYRLRASLTGSAALDQLRVGAHSVSLGNTGGSAIGTQWGFGSAYNGTVLCQMETLLLMHIEGPLATFLTACTDVDALVRSFWTTAIEI